MLAEVLHRVKKLFTAAAAAVFALTASGCEWDDAEIPDEESAADKVTSDDEILTEEEILLPEDPPEITSAKEVFEKWLGYLAEGECDKADEMITERLRSQPSLSRLFNEYFPGKASVGYFAPATLSENDGEITVVLRAAVSSEILPECKVNAEVSVRIQADGNAAIDQLREIGSSSSDVRMLYRKAYIAYQAAAEIFDDIDPVPYGGMHHIGDGSELTETVREKTVPSDTESFSIAVRDKKLMYVSWSNGAYTMRYPKAQ